MVGIGLWEPVLAAPTLSQCHIPLREHGFGSLKTPAPLPSSGELVIQFQRVTGEPTQARINFADVKDTEDFLEQIAKAINDESAQRPPKMTAVRERGLDQATKQQLGPILIIALNSIYRFLVISDPTEIQLEFQTPGSYTITCEALALGRTIPNLSEVTFESRPKVLYTAFPERVRSGRSSDAAVIFADKEDDVDWVRINYQAKSAAAITGVFGVQLGVPPLNIPSPYAPGLKAVKFQFSMECRPTIIPFSEVTLDARLIVRDRAFQESEPIKFTFVCEP
jgi:hypothetical protein